jgi:hypothetical protein
MAAMLISRHGGLLLRRIAAETEHAIGKFRLVAGERPTFL